MKVELFSTQGANEIADHIRSTFGVTDSQKILLCRGLSHALAECTRGLFSMYPHKMNLLCQKGGGPDIDSLAPYFSKEGCQVLSSSYQDLQETQAILNKIGKTGLCAILCDDDPLLGLLFNHSALETALEEKKIFTIRISYNAFLHDTSKLETNPYSIRILILAHGLAAVILGEKVRFERLLFGELYFENFLVKHVPDLICRKTQDKKVVIDFESKISSIASPILKNTVHRIYDRAVVAFSDIDGWAVEEFLSEELKKFSLNEKAQFISNERLIETSSLCKWVNPLKVNWLKDTISISDEQLRGLVCLDLSILTEHTLLALQSVYKKIKNLQGE